MAIETTSRTLLTLDTLPIAEKNVQVEEQEGLVPYRKTTLTLLDQLSSIVNNQKIHIMSEMRTLEITGSLNDTARNYYSFLLSELAGSEDIRMSHTKLAFYSGEEGLKQASAEMPLLADTNGYWRNISLSQSKSIEQIEEATNNERVEPRNLTVIYATSGLDDPYKHPIATFTLTENMGEIGFSNLKVLNSLSEETVNLITSIALETANSYKQEEVVQEEVAHEPTHKEKNGKNHKNSMLAALSGLLPNVIASSLSPNNGTSKRLQILNSLTIKPQTLIEGGKLANLESYNTDKIIGMLKQGLFPVVIPDFVKGSIKIGAIDLRGLGLPVYEDGTLPEDGMVTYSAQDDNGNITELERKRLEILTSRYTEKGYASAEKLREGLYIDGLQEKGFQASILWLDEGRAVAGMRFILPNVNPSEDISKVINGSSLRWLELPFHEHIPEPQRTLAREGIFFNYEDGVGYSGPIDTCKIIPWTEVSQLARIKGEKGNIWNDLYQLLISFGNYLRGSKEYENLVRTGTKLGVAISASPMIAKKLVSPSFRFIARTAGLNITQIGPTKYARGSEETPLLIYPV